MSRFATAPPWYRLVLCAQNAVLKPMLRSSVASPATPAAPELGLAPSSLTGALIAERMMPGTDVDAISLAYHLYRYVWALPRVSGKRVVDLGCGTGYGSYLLSWAAAEVTGVDLSEQALTFARSHYAGVRYEKADLTEVATLPPGDIAVCFEVLEHLSDPQRVIETALTAYPRALFSFPNPVWHNSELNPHHIQDWPLGECRRRFRQAGATSVELLSQRQRTGTVAGGYRPFASSWIFDVTR